MEQKRIMALDLGSKRIGVALSDPMNIIAQAYTTIIFSSRNKLIEDLKQIIDEKNVGTVVFGVPVTLSGEESRKTKETREFIKIIEEKLGDHLEYDLEDESMTTVKAHDIMRAMGKKPSKNKDKVDQIAAQQILSQYMERLS